jgi:penicillin G amidase
MALDSGDITYRPHLKWPLREHKVIQGAYPKKGHLPENSWKGFTKIDEIPYVVNPTRGYIVSCNNFVTSKNGEHGIGHAFSYQHRALRVGELIEGFIKSNKKMSARDSIKMASDLLDIQARAILPSMLKTIEAGKANLPNEDHHRINVAKHLFKNWNFEFDKDSVAASVYTSFEF